MGVSILDKISTAAREYAVNTTTRSATGGRLVPRQLRASVMRATGMEVGQASVEESVWFGSSNVSIGDGTYIGPGCFLDSFERITIGNRVSLAPQVSLITSTHEIGPHEQRAGQLHGKPITIEDGAWLGARCTVLPGVTIAKGCVIAAGAVVTKDTEPDCIYAGVPATLLRRLDGSSSETPVSPSRAEQ